MNDKPPKHVAIVMDGNGRWAKRKKLPRIAGHRAGAKSVRRAVEFCVEKEIEVLTLFALSVENRNSRPAGEVQFLMSLFLEALERNSDELHSNNVRVRIVGDRSTFSDKLLRQIDKSEQITKNNTGLNLVIAINYSGRWDIVQAAQRVAAMVSEQKLRPEEITESVFQQHLCLSDLPPPDLLIRTSGEQRISNFMLWQMAYTEMFFPDVYWPDFDAAVFQKALDLFASRERRFGLTSEQMEVESA